MSKTIIISAVNTLEGGTLTVLRKCLASLLRMLIADWRPVAPLNRLDLINVFRAEWISFLSPKKSLLRRVWYEWFSYQRLARQLTSYTRLSAKVALGADSLPFLFKLSRVQIRTETNAALQYLLLAIGLPNYFLRNVLAGKEGR